ncbi:hypothetical protein SANTM175S_00410 [Streptomyces antimycoticus]
MFTRRLGRRLTAQDLGLDARAPVYAGWSSPPPRKRRWTSSAGCGGRTPGSHAELRKIAFTPAGLVVPSRDWLIGRPDDRVARGEPPAGGVPAGAAVGAGTGPGAGAAAGRLPAGGGRAGGPAGVAPGRTAIQGAHGPQGANGPQGAQGAHAAHGAMVSRRPGGRRCPVSAGTTATGAHRATG